MKRILTAIVLVPLVLFAIFRAPYWMLLGIAGLFALLSAHEYLNIVEAYGIRPLKRATMVLMLLLFVPYSAFAPRIGSATIPLTLLPLIPLVLLIAAMRGAELRDGLPAAAASLLAFPYIAFGLAAVVLPVAWSTHGRLLVFYVLVVVWSGDIFALYVGRSVGRHKMSPRISPNKTWEGGIASVVGSAALGVLILRHLDRINHFFVRIHFIVPDNYLGLVWQPVFRDPPLWKAIAASVIINVMAQSGDLVESLIKRGAGVKDSGHLLPGHGGVLDRVDALLFAAPIAVLIFTVLHLNP